MMFSQRHSIFLKLGLLFAIAFVSISIVFLIFMGILERRQVAMVLNDSRHISRIIRTTDAPYLASTLEEEGYTLVQRTKIPANVKEIAYPKKMPPFLRKRIQAKRLQILKHGSDIYFDMRMKGKIFLIKNRPYPRIVRWILLSYIAVVGILFLMYWALRRSLKPIKKLEHEIKRFGEGALDIDTKSDKKDEIAAVGNQFDKAVQKINALQNTRTLFLRNMMHELKTPITKGKLSLSLMPENSESQMLEKVFFKLESLIEEMAQIEQITTHNIVIKKKEHRLIDIIDHASDLLYLQHGQVIHTLTDESLFCDFKLMSIAVKNLMDNAIKYSPDHIVEIKADEKSIRFINHANALKYDFSQYIEPFYKGELNISNQQSFGLGLYIVSEIVKLHGYSLHYLHEKEKNIFMIKY